MAGIFSNRRPWRAFLSAGLAAAGVVASGCASGWKGPTAPVVPLPTGHREAAVAEGLPIHEQWTWQGSAFLATQPAAVGHFLAVGDRKGQVQFLDPNTGRRKAMIKGKGAIRHELVWDPYRVYLVTEHSGRTVQAFDLDGGKRSWYRKFSYPPEAPILAGAELWLPVRDTLYALSPETGEPIRAVVAGGDLWGTPVKTGTGWLLWGRHGALLGLESDGARKWKVELNTLCSERPVVSGDTLWVSTSVGTLLCLDGEGELIFEQNLDSTALFAAAVGTDGVYVGAASGNVWALDPAGGEVMWQRFLEAPLSGSTLLHGGWLAATLLDGRLALLDAATGELLESVAYESILPWAPVWAFGRLYFVDSDRRVHALGVSP